MRIDWQALEIAFDSAEPEVQAWLDLRTGEVLLCYAMEQEAERAEFADRIAKHPDRYAEVKPPGNARCALCDAGAGRRIDRSIMKLPPALSRNLLLSGVYCT